MIPVLFINLDSENTRREYQEAQCKKFGLEYRILKAVTEGEISQDYRESHGRSWARPLSDTELACTLSHKKAWEIVLETGQPHLVCEDDVFFSPDIASLLVGVEEFTEYDLVQFETFMRTKLIGRIPVATVSHRKIHLLYQSFGGSAGYVLWPSGAEILLSKSERETAPADAFINDNEHLFSAQIVPAAAVQFRFARKAGIDNTPDNDSTITNNPRPKPDSPSSAIRYRLRRLQVELRKLLVIFKTLHKSKKIFIQFE